MFGGKELQDDVVEGSSLVMYDFRARNYDVSLGGKLPTYNKSVLRSSPFGCSNMI